ncbi:hypothetical protein WICMUC_004092 [Wickerhamomyces mucosus]|uniref:Transcriptional regulator n=1 Tax=Wickerhamomyces mucosus TaxID=1378264 RepID=A0A9P8PJP9_9ASCO|nr:hypothetical protein WICMUC_004092 [Wickerhamomyces mucosus]
MGWYVPKAYKVEDLDQQLQVIKDFPLGVLLTSSTSYLSNETDLGISHLPFVIKKKPLYDDEGQLIEEKLYLLTHIAKGNDQINHLEKLDKVKIIFKSTNSYVSASWYLQKKIDHKVVSTWDYSAVHIDGKPKLIKDHDGLLEILKDVTTFNEDKRSTSDNNKWKVEDAPSNYIDSMMKGIVGLEVEITNIESCFKFQQGKPAKEVLNIIKNYNEEISNDQSNYMVSLTQKVNSSRLT